MSDDAWYGLEDLNLIFYSNPDPLGSGLID
jgi:hypothetical protein